MYGPQALGRAADRWPDPVVLEVMPPGTDRLEVCRGLREVAPAPVAAAPL
ncbi:hypothetical protein ABZ070_19730 [Streptomyces sp. NPDC006283]